MSFQSPSPRHPLSLPIPLKDASQEVLKKIRGICLDIDDTLSTSGKLTSQAYEALWSLKNAGFKVVPITGRPAGWCDHFARFWPIDAIVGENGAFTFFMKDGIRKRIDTLVDSEKIQSQKEKLQKLAHQIQLHFPQARWASDQAYREYDLAIDVCEDVLPWNSKEVHSLMELCKNQGAHVKLSSIHVNTWFGDYDKASGFQYWLSQGAPGCSNTHPGHKDTAIPTLHEWIYIGDSPNDEPMFATFAHSVGVANLKKYLSNLTHSPTWITENESGAGFCELAKALIQAK